MAVHHSHGAEQEPAAAQLSAAVRPSGRKPQQQVFEKLLNDIPLRIQQLACGCSGVQPPCFVRLSLCFGGASSQLFHDFVLQQTQVNNPAQFNDPARRQFVFNYVHAARQLLPTTGADGAAYDSSRFILSGVFLCCEAFMGLTGLSKRQIRPVQRAVAMGHNTV